MDLASELLMNVRKGGPTEVLLDELAARTPTVLRSELADEQVRKAFWLNLYNAFAQLALQEASVDLRDRFVRMRLFGDRRFTVARHALSLNDIEHGMLRHSQQWWGLGYVPKPFPSAFERHLRVPRDPRIHFALNCGAGSCPAIAYYRAGTLEVQLDDATQHYLKQEVAYDPDRAVLRVPALFQWFSGDFGGEKGIVTFLATYGIQSAQIGSTIRYKPFNWTTRTFPSEALYKT